MRNVAVLYLDEDDRKVWEGILAGVPDLVGMTAGGDPTLPLQRLRGMRSTLRVIVLSARLYPGRHPELAPMLREACPGAELLLVSCDGSAPPLKPLFADRIRHLTISPAFEEPHSESLPAVIAMLVERRPWEVRSCLKAGTPVHSYRLDSSEDKELLIARLEGVLAGEGEEMDLLRQKGALLADELLENALYNAPRGTRGDRLFMKGERRAMLPHEQIVFSFGFDGETLALKLTDSWGSLEPDQVLEYLTRNEEQSPISDDAGGRGLFIIWRFLDQFHVDVEPGHRTTVGGQLQLSSRLEPDSPRGFHITKHTEEKAA